jgi:hypothetical protein
MALNSITIDQKDGRKINFHFSETHLNIKKLCSVIKDIQKQFPYRNSIGCMEIEESIMNNKKKYHTVRQVGF